MDYSKYLSNKFQVAIAIAVLKSKPTNMTTDQYIAQLQHSIKLSGKGTDLECISIASIDFEDDIIEDTAECRVEMHNSNVHKYYVDPQTSNKDAREKTIQYQNYNGKLNAKNNDAAASTLPLGIPIYGHPITDSQETYVSLDNFLNLNDLTQHLPDLTQEYGRPLISSNEMVSNVNTCKSTDPNVITIDNVNNLDIAKDISTQDKRMETDYDIFSQSQDIFCLTQGNIIQAEYAFGIDNEQINFDKTKQFDKLDEYASKNQTIKSADARLPERQATDVADTELAKTQTYLTDIENLNEMSADTTENHRQEIEAEHQNNNKTTDNNTPELERTAPFETQEEFELSSQIENCIDLLSQALTEPDEDNKIVPMELDNEVPNGVPFKVIMELNKMKTILSTMDGKMEDTHRHTLPDSGYKTDSQRSFYQLSLTSGSQLSESYIDQSVYGLIKYLTDCPTALLVDAVTVEVAETVARVVDITQERASVPTFLEHVLSTVDGFMQDICTEGCGGDLLLKKDDSLNRLCHFSRSIEISSYSIDKILDFLDKFYHRFTQNAEITYEIGNIDEMENICYVFHTLEILLIKYLEKRKTNSAIGNASEELPATQKELQLSISDIWRKRWDPNYNSVTKQTAVRQSRDVTDRCMTLLNKFIVHCMDGYSLVSYAALECFNCLQNS